jgi:hypothetical protein
MPWELFYNIFIISIHLGIYCIHVVPLSQLVHKILRDECEALKQSVT